MVGQSGLRMSSVLVSTFREYQCLLQSLGEMKSVDSETNPWTKNIFVRKQQFNADFFFSLFSLFTEPELMSS
jgi:hypothetical protein